MFLTGLILEMKGKMSPNTVHVENSEPVPEAYSPLSSGAKRQSHASVDHGIFPIMV